MLVFGGDEVYPYPTRTEYDTRTETPYKLAFAGRPRPDVFAIPGNHDWYDSLVAFSRTFCRPERGFAGCPTRQTRSYFALKLPANWWLLAIDLQLGADLDEPQVQYFQKVAARMDDAARLIFCVPEPRWILEDAYPSHSSYEELTSTRFLEEKVFRRKARVFLTGDLHFYKRHENAEGIQKITSGGGGAFLHPTHAPDTKQLRNGFAERAAYPDEKTSRRLSWRNLLFPFINPKSGWLYAFLYAMSAWLASASLEASDIIDLPTALAATMNAAIRDPLNGMWLVSIIGGIHLLHRHARSLVANPGRRLSRAAASGGGVRGRMGRVAAHDEGLRSRVRQHRAAADVRARHLPVGRRRWVRSSSGSIYSSRSGSSDATATRRSRRFDIQDFKQWLRLRIDAAGGLTIHAIAIDRVPRRWRSGAARRQVDDRSGRRASQRSAAHRQG